MTNSGYLAFDPGISTGFVGYDDEGEISDGMCNFEGIQALEDYLATTLLRPKIVICEDYVIRNARQLNAHKGSRVPTTRAIGMIRMACRMWGSKLVMQDPRVLTIGFKWAGIDKPKDSDHAHTHYLFAHAHGVYYLQKNGLRKSRLAMEEERNK